MGQKVALLLGLMVPLLAGVGCAARLQGEDLGGGFSRVTKGTELPADHLFFRGADLGRVGFVSVAPSGAYAIFERDGGLFLIASADGNLKPVTDGEFLKPAQVRWNETQRFAQIDYVDDRPSTRVELSGSP